MRRRQVSGLPLRLGKRRLLAHQQLDAAKDCDKHHGHVLMAG